MLGMHVPALFLTLEWHDYCPYSRRNISSREPL
jgi:hypothetical protein